MKTFAEGMADVIHLRLWEGTWLDIDGRLMDRLDSMGAPEGPLSHHR